MDLSQNATLSSVAQLANWDAHIALAFAEARKWRKWQRAGECINFLCNLTYKCKNKYTQTNTVELEAKLG